MIRNLFRRTVMLALLLASSSSFAAFELDNNTEVSDTGVTSAGALGDNVYYQIGGGDVSTRPAARRSTYRLGIGTQWQGLQMCGGLDLNATVTNQLNGVTNGFKNMMTGIVNQATSAVASLPALIIKRANPDLYDLINNGVLQARADFDKGMLSCQRMTDKMGEVMGGSSWQEVATAATWQKAAQSGDAAAAEQQVALEAGNDGLPWVDGEARGGLGQQPVEVTRDTMVAGYNILNGRADASDKTAVRGTDCTGGLCSTWSTPAEAADFMTRVVGEQTIRTCDSCKKSETSAGVGLAPLIQEEQEKIATALQDLVAGNTQATPRNLADASGGSMQVTRQLVDALRKDPDQQVLINRLAGEMALVRVLERSMWASRALLAGMREPNIANVNDAVEANERSLATLDREINTIATELELRRTLSNNTAMAALGRMQSRDQQAEPVFSGDPEVDRVGDANKTMEKK